MILSLDSAPPWATISPTGLLTVAPSAPLGANVLTVRATDGATTATKQITVNVVPIDPQPIATLAKPVKQSFELSFSSSVLDSRLAIQALDLALDIEVQRVAQVQSGLGLSVVCTRLDTNPGGGGGGGGGSGQSPSTVLAGGYTWDVRYFSNGNVVATWDLADSLEAELAFGSGGSPPQLAQIGCATAIGAQVKTALDSVLVPDTAGPATCYQGAGILFNGGDGVVLVFSK